MANQDDCRQGCKEEGAEMKKDLEPAFPRPYSGTSQFAQVGMTLRDYFAAKAMQALIARETRLSQNPMLYTGASYDFADAMMKARME